MLGVLEEPIFERRLQVLESGCSQRIRSAGRAEAAIGRSKRHRERLGDAFGKFGRYIALPEGGIVAGLEIGDGRKGQFIVDAGIVDAERRGKEAVADDFVGDAFTKRNEHYREPW